MKIDRKGFTLVELIISIAIIAALSMAAIFGLQRVLTNNRLSGYKADLKELSSSTRTYLGIKSSQIIETSTMQSIKLKELVQNGYIHENIYQKKNGLTCEQFSEDTDIYYNFEDGMKKIYIKVNSDYCYLDELDSCTIREC